MSSSSALLELEHIDAGYGKSQVLFGMGLAVPDGRCVTLLGRNGMGKSTTVKTVMGLIQPTRGVVRWQGQAIHGLPPFAIAQLGLGLVPEGRQVFPNLTVRENLVATAARRHGGGHAPWTLQRVHQLFPRLAERGGHFGNQLSGGEQQMLAIGRALMTNPRLLILDEATEGLSPLIRQEIWTALALIKSEGTAILLIDKNLKPLLGLADFHHIVEKGRVVWRGNSDALRQDKAALGRYLLTEEAPAPATHEDSSRIQA
jgi:branched-chain amino acid transport system ATP-binding protein